MVKDINLNIYILNYWCEQLNNNKDTTTNKEKLEFLDAIKLYANDLKEALEK